MFAGLMRAALSAAAFAVGAPAIAHEPGAGLVPLGDGRLSREPRQGYVFSCQTSFMPGAGGAQQLGPWAGNGYWRPDEKPKVRGAVSWPNAAISIAREGDERVLRANGLPRHATGVFPIERNDPAFAWDRNPNAIGAQNILMRLPATPSKAARPSCVDMGVIGVALTGVAIFNALDGAGRDAPAWEIQDACGGHPERSGVYHYHDFSPCMADAAGRAGKHSDLVGYALDGFGLFGPRGEGGKRLRNADLDVCHGHVHEIMWNGAPRVLYHHHFTDEYPYSLGCYTGTPATAPRPAPAGMIDGRAPPRGPGEAPPPGGQDSRRLIMRSAARELGISEERLRAAVGPPPPDFARAARELGIPEARIADAFRRARESIERAGQDAGPRGPRN